MNDQCVPKVYNTLYPAPCEELCVKLRNSLEVSPKIYLSTNIDFGTKQLYPMLIKRSLKIFQKLKCTGCSGSHQYYIAGGYASYLANLTDEFGDIDVFIHCTKKLDMKDIQSTNYEMTTNTNVSTIEYHDQLKPNVQFIQVNFDLKINKTLEETPLFRDLMGMYIVSKFDLPICRIAVILPITKGVKFGRIINLSAIELYKTPSSLARKEKYAKRRTDTPLTPPTLQQSTIFSLFNKF